jgi:hypothetical protein
MVLDALTAVWCGPVLILTHHVCAMACASIDRGSSLWGTIFDAASCLSFFSHLHLAYKEWGLGWGFSGGGGGNGSWGNAKVGSIKGSKYDLRKACNQRHD